MTLEELEAKRDELQATVDAYTAESKAPPYEIERRHRAITYLIALEAGDEGTAEGIMAGALDIASEVRDYAW